MRSAEGKMKKERKKEDFSNFASIFIVVRVATKIILAYITREQNTQSTGRMNLPVSHYTLISQLHNLHISNVGCSFLHL